jgi:hypothetical protein
MNLRTLALTATAVTLAWDPAGSATSSYWSIVSSHPDMVLAKRYNSQSQINADSKPSPNPYVTYDSVEDAAKIQMVTASLPNQVRPKLPQTHSTGTLLFVWDAKWHDHYGNATYRAGLSTHKCFQLANSLGPGDQRRIEPRMQYAMALSPDIAKVDTRVYPSPGTPRDTVQPQLAQFTVKPGAWTRRWAFVEFVTPTTVRYSEWIADETRAPVRIFNRASLTLPNIGGLNQFWFEYNSSQTRTAGAGPLVSWFRDLVVLAGLSESEAVLLVSQGAQVP